MVVCNQDNIVHANIDACKIGCCCNIPTGNITVVKHLVEQCNVIVFAPRISILNEQYACCFSCGNHLGVTILANLAGVGDLTVLLGGCYLGNNRLIGMSAGNGFGVLILTVRASVYGVTVGVAIGLNLFGDCVCMLGIYVSGVAVATTLTGMRKNTGGSTGYFSGNNRDIVVTERRNIDIFELLTANGTIRMLATGGGAGRFLFDDPCTGSVTGSGYVVIFVFVITKSTCVQGVTVLGTGGSDNALGIVVVAYVATATGATVAAYKALQNRIVISIAGIKIPYVFKIPAKGGGKPFFGLEI